MAIEDLHSKTDLMRFIREQVESEPLPQGAVEGLEGALSAGRMTPLTLLNGWSNAGGGYAGAAYQVELGGKVGLRGRVTKPELPEGTILCALPAALRPKERLIFLAASDSGFDRVDVDAGGNVILVEGTGGYLSLSQISFWPVS